MKRFFRLEVSVACAVISALATSSVCRAQVSFITGITFPATESAFSGSVTAPPYPLDVSTGAGFIINPGLPTNLVFSMHSHSYAAPNIPTPGIGVVTFTFDRPTVVDQLQVIEHANGVSKIEGFVGNSPGSLVSMGDIFGTRGDVTGSSVFTDGSTDPTPYVFDFNNLTAGTVYQFVVTKTSFDSGWALYRMFPADASGVQFGPALTAIPEPAATVALGGAIALGFVAALRRRAK